MSSAYTREPQAQMGVGSPGTQSTQSTQSGCGPSVPSTRGHAPLRRKEILTQAAPWMNSRT